MIEMDGERERERERERESLESPVQHDAVDDSSSIYFLSFLGIFLSLFLHVVLSNNF